MGMLTSAQICSPTPLPCPIPEIGTAHRSVPELIWESQNNVRIWCLRHWMAENIQMSAVLLTPHQYMLCAVMWWTMQSQHDFALSEQMIAASLSWQIWSKVSCLLRLWVMELQSWQLPYCLPATRLYYSTWCIMRHPMCLFNWLESALNSVVMQSLSTWKFPRDFSSIMLIPSVVWEPHFQWYCQECCVDCIDDYFVICTCFVVSKMGAG